MANRRKEMSTSLKFPLLLQIKFGGLDKLAGLKNAPKSFAKRVHNNLIQRITLVEKGG